MATETDTRNVHRRKLAVMRKCGAIKPDKKHFQGFDYVSIQELSNQLRAICADEGLDVVASITDGQVVLQLVNADEPADFITTTWPVIPGDKGWAYSVKYPLIRLFLVGDGEEGDEKVMADRSAAVASRPPLDPEAKERIVNEAREAKGHNSPPRRPDAPRVGPASLPGRPSVPSKPANATPDAPEEWFDDAALAAMDAQR